MIRSYLHMALVAVVGSASFLVGTAPAEAAPYTFLNLSFNLCGNKCNHGALAVANEVADSILNRPTRPRTATLQEVCASQAARIRSRLDPHRLPR
jgi:hypothetical protein